MQAEFIQPNLHVVAIHFPLGLLTAGVLVEAFSFLGWRRTTLHAAGRWMVLLGALLSFPAAMTGFYALRDIAGAGYAPTLNELRNESAFSTEHPLVRDAMYKHVLFNSIAAGASLLAVCLWIAMSNGARRVMHIPLVIVLLGTVALAGAGAHEGGKLVHELRASDEGVEDDVKAKRDGPALEDGDGLEQAEEADGPTTGPAVPPPLEPTTRPTPANLWTGQPNDVPPATVPAVAPVSPSTTPPTTTLATAPPAPATPAPPVSLFPPDRPAAETATTRVADAVDTAKDAAGSAARSATQAASSVAAETVAYPDWLRRAEPFAPPLQVHLWMSGLAIGLSLIALATSMRAATEPAPILPPPYSVDPAVTRIGDAFNPKPLDNTLPAPAARVWVITLIATLVAGLLGAWYLATNVDPLSLDEMWKLVKSRDSESDPALTRRLAHVIGGGAMIGLPILMAIFARTARRSGLLVLILGVLSLALVVAQVWVGLLLLLDSPAGSVWKLNP